MTKKVLILGAGAAGSVVANKLAREFRREIAQDRVEITMLDRSEVFVNQGGFTFIPFGLYTPEDIIRPRRELISPRVKGVFGTEGEIKSVDLANREVKTKTDRSYSYDYLVIATGCVADVEGVPGLASDLNTFYVSLEYSFKLRTLVQGLKKGRVVISVARMPIPCPGAPGKFAILLDSYLRYFRGEEVRKNVDITFLWPMEPIGPAAYDDAASQVFKEQGIKVRRSFKLAEVDSANKEVIAESGEKEKYDLLITIPPHRSIQALQDSGLTDSTGWVPADKNTLQYSGSAGRYDEVYVLGDTGPVEVVKTGIGAHYQSLVVSQNLANDLHGNGIKESYMGELGCPFIGSMYTPATRGKAYIPTWTYNSPPDPFTATKLGWFLYRMYYYIFWDAGIKGLM